MVRCSAAIGDGEGRFSIEDIEVGTPGPGEARIRLAAAGLCHTDHASLRWPGPLVLGHEGAGHVEALGEGTRGFRVGDPVLLNWAIPCGACPQCRRGRGSLCERTHGVDPSLGTSRAAPGHARLRCQAIERSFNLGTFCGYSVVRAEALTLLPPQLSLRHACIMGCGVMTGVGAVLNVASVQPGDTVVVVGCGGVGLSVIQGARLAGAGRVIAIDRRPVSLERARAMGATHLVPVAGEDIHPEGLAARVRELTNGRGADHAFEATGVAALAFLPLKLVRNGGNAVQLSGSHGPLAATLPDFMWDKRYLVPLYGGCQPERDFPRLVEWARTGELRLAGMVTHTYRLESLDRAFEDLLAGTCAKGVILFDDANA